MAASEGPRKKRTEGGAGLASVYAALSYAFGWTPDTIERLTIEQAELFIELARDEREADAKVKAHEMEELFVGILKAAGMVR